MLLEIFTFEPYIIKGNARAAYDSKINIAKYFESSNLMDISEKHYKEALDIAKMLPSSEFIVEIEANLNYGVFLEHTGENLGKIRE